MKHHETLKRLALRALRAVFDDTSVPAEKTRDTLEELIEEMEIWIESLGPQTK